MVIAFHLIFTAYGFWLPNDPRSFWSNFVRSWDLYLAAGPATKTTSRKSIAAKPHNHAARLAAKSALHYAPVEFTPAQQLAIAAGFHHALTRSTFKILACSILPTHIHLVIPRHTYPIEQVMNQLKGEAAKSLSRQNLHPFQSASRPSGKRHSPWSEDGWDVYLETPHEIHRSITYVNQNPIKAHHPQQHWPFITSYPTDLPPPIGRPV